MKVTVACPCGQTFETTKNRIAAGRGKRCSRACSYEFVTRPSGLKYEIKATNRGWFKPGHVPVRAGTRKPRVAKGRPEGEAHHGWKGDEVGLSALHGWVKRHRTKAAACEHCGRSDKPLDWANKSGEYRRDLADWLSLCRSCHKRYDLRRLGKLRCAV